MPYREFIEWGCYIEDENCSYSQTDVNLASIAVHVNNFLSKKKIKISDILPKAITKKQSKKEFKTNLKMIVGAINRGVKQ